MLLAISKSFIDNPPYWFYLIPITLVVAALLTILHAYAKSDYKPKESPESTEHHENYHEVDIKNFYSLDDEYTT